MKNLITCTLAAALVAGVAAQPQHHQHAHHHARKQAGSKVEKREPSLVTEYVVAATETVYKLGGEVLDGEAAKKGLDGGNLVVVGESNPTYTPPPPPPKSTSEVASATLGAQFIEKVSSSSSVASPAPPPATSSTTPIPTSIASTPSTPASSASKAKTSTGSAPSSSGSGQGSSGSQGQGVDSTFPSGKVKCSEFPSAYGAVALSWLNMGGWSGIQYVPDYTTSSSSISKIITGIAGDSCTSGAMCSYACPPGYQKTQWPKAQGSTKESIGGLYCNSDGYLELTRPEYTTLCDAGAGGVTIQNDLSEVVATCRTDYPGTESMVIPALAGPGESVAVCNPIQNEYYVWDNSGTSAQYYINKKGYGTKDACVWNSAVDPDGAGNWSPLILGVGKASDGVTYISIFQNLPTSHAKLDFNVEITGDVSIECSYINGVWSSGTDKGCTTGVRSGGKAVVRYF